MNEVYRRPCFDCGGGDGIHLFGCRNPDKSAVYWFPSSDRVEAPLDARRSAAVRNLFAVRTERRPAAERQARRRRHWQQVRARRHR